MALKFIYIYTQTRVSFFAGLISVAWVNKYRTTDVTRVLKAPGVEYIYNIYIHIYYSKKRYGSVL